MYIKMHIIFLDKQKGKCHFIELGVDGRVFLK
jgi:hypothetical protein